MAYFVINGINPLPTSPRKVWYSFEKSKNLEIQPHAGKSPADPIPPMEKRPEAILITQIDLPFVAGAQFCPRDRIFL
jgi:hypothetical protein